MRVRRVVAESSCVDADVGFGDGIDTSVGKPLWTCTGRFRGRANRMNCSSSVSRMLAAMTLVDV